MNGQDNLADSGPFPVRVVLAMVLFGGAVFVALLWMIGSGMTGARTNDGGGHAGGKGLNGYAALAALLEQQGVSVHRVQNESGLDDPGLLVLTPPANAEAKEIARIVDARRRIGPTLVITPKWQAVPARALDPAARQGWVKLAGAGTPDWPGFLDDVGVAIEAEPAGTWVALNRSGRLPSRDQVESGRGRALVPLVMTRSGHVLAAYYADGGHYPWLDELALGGHASPPAPDQPVYPLVVVFEPDLLDNYGMADSQTALQALDLVRAALGNGPRAVSFDLTFNGFKRNANLLTLAFQPPFLAATLCLLLAALAVGWRAFCRFGPPTAPPRAIAFGKRALVSSAAGLIRRSARLHLLAEPYAALVRDRLMRQLALPRQADVAAAEAAIDRALAARTPDAAPFSVISNRLRAARRPAELLRAGKALHALERTLG